MGLEAKRGSKPPAIESTIYDTHDIIMVERLHQEIVRSRLEDVSPEPMVGGSGADHRGQQRPMAAPRFEQALPDTIAKLSIQENQVKTDSTSQDFPGTDNIGYAFDLETAIVQQLQ